MAKRSTKRQDSARSPQKASRTGTKKASPSTTPKTSRKPAKGSAAAQHSIGAYLIQRLQDYGVRHVFGIPGDFVLGFYGMLEESPIDVIGMTREDCAGYAADAYARVNGMGCVCVTYCVGGLSLCNSIAGAYARLPLPAGRIVGPPLPGWPPADPDSDP